MDETLDISCERALELGQEFLAGHWSALGTKDICLSVLKGGYCSRLYVCADKTGKCEPSKFLIRLMGGKIIEEDEPLKTHTEGSESIVFFKHGELGYGPKLYGLFKGGRLEEYIPSRTLCHSDLTNSDIRKQIARKLARFHSMDLPVSKKQHPEFKLFINDFDAYDTVEGRKWFLELSKKTKVDPSWVDMVNWRSEFKWLQDMRVKVGGRLVLCTIDMNFLNCLIREEPDSFGEIVTLVDYEMGCTNHRGHDIGNHFVMWINDISNVNGFLSSVSFPSNDIRREFVTAYLIETQKIKQNKDFDEKGIDSVEHVMMEADFQVLMSVTIFVTFMLKPKRDDHIICAPEEGKNFWIMVKRMVELYIERKAYFLEKYSIELDGVGV